jgi:transposase
MGLPQVKSGEAVIGIDVAKEKLDVVFLAVAAPQQPIHKVFKNTKQGQQDVLVWVKRQGGQAVHACMEATGSYGEQLAETLHEAGYVVSVVNPARIKKYGESELLRIKTDKTDAALIARFCLQQRPRAWSPPSPQQRHLRDLLRAREDLQQQGQQLHNRLQATTHEQEVQAALQAVLSVTQAQIVQLDIQIAHFIAAHEDLKQLVSLVSSIKGIGVDTAITLVAELGDLSQFEDADALVAHLGLSPHQRRSGRRQRGASPLSKIGDRRVRQALYFPAMVAARFNPQVKALYQRLLARGKLKMVALGAAMRKLARIIFGVVRSGKPFDPAYGMKAA